MTRLQKQTGSLRDIQRDLKELNELRGTSIVFFLIKVKALPTDLCMTGLGMADSSRDADLYNEILVELVGVRERAQELTKSVLLSEPADVCSAYIDVKAGSGGTEACDWAGILSRMYTRWAQSHGYTGECVPVFS